MVESGVQIDERQYRRVQRELDSIGVGMSRLIHTATKRVTDKSRAEVVRGVHATLNVKVRDLYQKGNKRRPIRQAYVRGAKGITGGRVTVDKGRMRLGRFTPRQHWKSGKTRGRVRTRVSYKIQRGGSRGKIKDAFTLEFASGYEGVFRREGSKRLPLRELFGPSAPQVAEQSTRVRRYLDSGAARAYAAEVESRLAFLVARGRA